MRRLIRFIFQLITLVVIFVILTTVWVIVDGVTDVGEKADVAVFEARPGSGLDTQLDRLAKLIKDGEIRAIILCEPEDSGTHERFDSATKYLTEHDVPGNAIVDRISYLDTWDMAGKISHAVKSQEYATVMLVTDYYRMTRMKMALAHEGVFDIRKNHLGWIRGEDVIPVATEVVTLYEYIGTTYLLPTAKKIKEEAQVGADKVKKDAEAAKKKVDQGLDNLPK